jgi:hypothetical protein
MNAFRIGLKILFRASEVRVQVPPRGPKSCCRISFLFLSLQISFCAPSGIFHVARVGDVSAPQHTRGLVARDKHGYFPRDYGTNHCLELNREKPSGFQGFICAACATNAGKGILILPTPAKKASKAIKGMIRYIIGVASQL